MPTVPKTKSLNADGVQILNTIRANASLAYQDRVPKVTRENFADVGKIIIEYDAFANEFLTNLVNRIGLVMISSRLYENPLRMLKKGMLNYGESIEDIFVNLMRAHDYDPELAEKFVEKRELPDVDAVFYRVNRKEFYKVTVEQDELKLALLTPEGVTDLVGRIVQQLSTSNNFDEYVLTKRMIVNALANNSVTPIQVPVLSATTAVDYLRAIKLASDNFTFMSDKYNAFGVANFSDKSSQILIMDTTASAFFDVDVLANAFNMDKVQFLGRQIIIDDFGISGVHAMLVDEGWFQIYDKLLQMKQRENEEGLYWNHWLHVWQLFAMSPYSNAVVFTESESSVTSVGITPNAPTVPVGTSIQFTPVVDVTGNALKTVHWEITDCVCSSGTYIDAHTGKLVVSPHEQATQLNIKATSVSDPTKCGTAVVTITGQHPTC